MAQGMVKIDTIVKESLADKGYDTLHLYAKYLMYALRCLRELNIDHTEDIKTVKLPVSAIKTVAYPKDYITYNKLGIKIGDRMMAFVRDNTITSHHIDRYTANSPFTEVVESALSTLRFSNYYPNPNLGSSITGSYSNYIDMRGYAHNGVGYFKPVNECREFQLSADISATSVLLEYIYDNFNPDSETFVTIPMREVIRQYIHYQDSIFRNGASLGLRKEHELDFLNALSDYDKRISDLSYQGILDSLRINTTLGIKG